MGIGGGLDGKILLKAWIPGEGPVQAAGGFTDALLIVKVEGGGVLFDDFLELLQGDKGLFHGQTLLFQICQAVPGRIARRPKKKIVFIVSYPPYVVNQHNLQPVPPPGPSFGDSGKKDEIRQ